VITFNNNTAIDCAFVTYTLRTANKIPGGEVECAAPEQTCSRACRGERQVGYIRYAMVPGHGHWPNLGGCRACPHNFLTTLVQTVSLQQSTSGNSPRRFDLPMIHTLILLALSSFTVQVESHPTGWLRKFSSSARPDATSWLWGWAWASDGSVSIVDRSPPVVFSARPASFGAELVDPLLGYVIPLSAFTVPCQPDPITNETNLHGPDPIQGCPHLCVDGRNQPDPTESWIALVQRGGCPFVEKARQAQQLGAKAVVVGGNSDNPDALLNMYSEKDSPDVTIAATFINHWDYLELLSLISASNTTHSGLKTLSLLISTEYSAWEWYSPIVTFVVILLLPSLLTFVTLLVHRFRAARAAQRDRAPEDIVHSFPWRVWTGTGWEKHDPTYKPAVNSSISEPDLEQGLTRSELPTPSDPSTSHDSELPPWVEQQVECAICLEMFAQGDRVRVLPCFHMFHLDEVDEWLIHKKKLCPVCKMDVTIGRLAPQLPPTSLTEEADSAAPGHTSPAATERTPLLQGSNDDSYEAAQ